jgi:hypothetical protein
MAGNGEAGFLDGRGDATRFNQPYNVKADAMGRLFVPDQNNHAIRRVDPDGAVMTLAGNGEPGTADGTGATARFDNPTGLAIAGDGTVYVADRNNHLLRAVTPAGQVSTIAGDGTGGFRDGPGPQAQFKPPARSPCLTAHQASPVWRYAFGRRASTRTPASRVSAR